MVVNRSDVQVQIDAAGGSSVDLSNLNLSGKLDIDASDAAVEMRKTGYGTTFKVQAGNNYGLMQYGGCKQWMVPESGGNGRIKFEGDLLQVPAHTGQPGQNEANCKGSLWYDTSADELMCRTSGAWQSLDRANPTFTGNQCNLYFDAEGVFNMRNGSNAIYQQTVKSSYLKCKWSGGAYLYNLNSNGRIDVKDEAYFRMEPRAEPSGAQDGSFYYDSTASAFKFRQGGAWVTLS